MPVADSGGADWSWLQSLLASQGAGQPYGPGGAPGPYSGGPQGLMPGGGLLGYPATTPGQPSMGFPAAGQAAGRPSVAPGTQQAANPILRALNYLNPISSAQADVLHPNLTNPNLTPLAPAAPAAPPAPAPSRTLPPGAANSLPLAWGNPTSDDYRNWLQTQLTASPAAGPAMPARPVTPTPQNYPSWPTPPAPQASSPAAPIPGPLANAPMPPPRPAGQARTPASPTTAPPSAAQSSAFVPIERPNLPATGYSPGDRMMTALNLARLFGRA